MCGTQSTLLLNYLRNQGQGYDALSLERLPVLGIQT
ncbi:hypothetical protein BH09CHL1_BH09CHL1_30870 [soil metagenome]